MRLPFRLVHDRVLPLVFDDAAPVRRGYQTLLAGCDRAATSLLDDHIAVHAGVVDYRNPTARDAIAGPRRRTRTDAEVVLERHRARFRERRCRPPPA